MAFREVDMWEVLQILRRLGRRESKSSIKRATGADRKTIRNYEAIALELGWSAESDTEPTEELAGAVIARVRPGPEANRTPTERLLAPFGPQLKQWLLDEPDSPSLLLTKIHQLITRQGVDVGYSSLRRYAAKHCGYHDRRRVTVRMAGCEPGEVAEVDFGQLGRIFDPITGRNRVLHALIVTLVYSRHQYVHVTYSQKLPAVIEGLENAWRYFGGVPRRVIVDNMKTAVVRACPSTAYRFDHNRLARKTVGQDSRISVSRPKEVCYKFFDTKPRSTPDADYSLPARALSSPSCGRRQRRLSGVQNHPAAD